MTLKTKFINWIYGWAESRIIEFYSHLIKYHQYERIIHTFYKNINKVEIQNKSLNNQDLTGNKLRTVSQIRRSVVHQIISTLHNTVLLFHYFRQVG